MVTANFSFFFKVFGGCGLVIKPNMAYMVACAWLAESVNFAAKNFFLATAIHLHASYWPGRMPAIHFAKS